MEGHVLSTLNWLIGHPTAEAWLRVSSIHDPSLLASDSNTLHIARFLMEVTLFHRAFVALRASEVALGCLLLARFISKKERCSKEETPLAVQIAQMLDGHLAEHLEQLSTIVLKKCKPEPSIDGETALKKPHRLLELLRQCVYRDKGMVPCWQPF